MARIGDIRYKFVDSGLQDKLKNLGALDTRKIIKRNAGELYNRTQHDTPVSTELTRPGGPHGELRRSAGVSFYPGGASVGYTKEYAPHVEFGHRTPGGYVYGQYFLREMAEKQHEIIAEDIMEAIKNA